jgi:basic membrane protein A and related proteins
MALLVIVSLFFTGCGSKPAPATQAAEPLKVCMITSSSINDMGWSYANERGRLYMNDHVKNITSTLTDQISDTGGADVVKVIEDLITIQNCKVIIGTSFGYSEAIGTEATKHPEIKFLNESQYVAGPNIQSHWTRYYEGLYLTGALAASMTKTNIIGMVATFPIPELVRRINGYALGAQSVNPNVIVKVVWTGSWYDPAKETEAANSLIAAGADVIQHLASDTAALQAAETAGVYSIGYQNDQLQFAPKYGLTSMMINWGPIYATSMQKILDGTWTSGEIWFGLAEGVVGVGPYGPAVPDNVKATIADIQAKIISGKIKIWAGPIYDQNGTVQIPAGETWTDAQILNMNYFVKGIEGSIPTQ